jgi:uncharacterized protein (TIGR03118 family)
MHFSFPVRRSRRWAGTLALVAGVGLAITPSALGGSHAADRASSHHHHGHSQAFDHSRTIGRYAQRDLVADRAGAAELTDPALVNAWGLSFGPATPAWVSDAGTGVSTLYRGGVGSSPVAKVPLTVSIPGGVPTGQVFNGTTGFVVSAGGASGAAAFLFASGTGIISGWNTNVPAPGSTQAQPAVTVPGASFTGLAISGDRLYAADFHNARVDVWDSGFNRVNDAHAFRDPSIPAGYAPFGIEATGGNIVVTYAKQDANAQFDVPGKGHGFVDVYSTSGRLLKRLARRGTLNSPWGIAQAPADFGAAAGALLIGNFGDGRIQAYDPRNGRFLGQLGDSRGHGRRHDPVTIPGLWALKFGNGVIGASNALLFTAGPSQGTHGLFGELTAATSTSTQPGTPAAPGY